MIVVAGIFCAVVYFFPRNFNAYNSDASNSAAIVTLTATVDASSTSTSLTTSTASTVIAASVVGTTTSTTGPAFVATHIPTPAMVKGIYMSGWVAGSPSFRDTLVNLINTTELNAVVIDIKDSTGVVSFSVNDPALVAVGSASHRISDIQQFIASLHAKGVYVIGRIATFEDPYYSKTHPADAVQTKAGAVWKDNHGISWVDAGAKPFWDYIGALGKESYADGFDELNFDYIRFPTDGNMDDISYPYVTGQTRAEVIDSFFTYVDNTFRPLGIPISADLFGETTVDTDDMGIGQVIENALAHFDYVSPMVYPSHFADGFNGWKTPAAHPYEIVDYSMSRGEARAYTLANATSTITKTKVGTTTAITVTPLTPPAHVGQLRPWLQDFSLGSTPYTPIMVREQIQATYNSGVDEGWLLWNAANKYDSAALLSPDDTLSGSTDFATSTTALDTYAAP